jgi:peptide/nickel transport system ATP-binding protein
MTPLLEIRDLSIDYKSDNNVVRAVDSLSFALEKGDLLGVVGESGSGKTTLALGIMGLLPENVKASGSIFFKGRDLVSMPEREKDAIKWKNIAIVFQNSLEVLNPVIKVGDQVREPMIRHLGIGNDEARRKSSELFQLVGLDAIWLDAYPHQLSGGMRQRALIAMALSCQPDILILDEVTSALDAFTKMEIRDLLVRLQKEAGYSMMLISHDITFLSSLTTRMMVMYAGRIMERGNTAEMIDFPMHPYTRGLINSTPGIFLYRDLWGIPGEAPAGQMRGCPFSARCTQRIDLCDSQSPDLKPVDSSNKGGSDGENWREVACHLGGIVTLLKASGMNYSYRLPDGKTLNAVKDACLDVRESEVLAVVGQTGSGKSTLAHMLAGVMGSGVGEIFFKGNRMNGDRYGSDYGGIQIVFQDPINSTNSRFTVLDAIKEPLDINKLESPKERVELVKATLLSVGLPSSNDFLRRYCGSLSGGQRQRVAIARALIMRPKLLIADEITSALDVSTAANVLRLLKGLQNSRGFAMIYITHDLMIALKVADRIAVMDEGRIIETGNAHQVMLYPKEASTKRLVGARMKGGGENRS